MGVMAFVWHFNWRVSKLDSPLRVTTVVWKRGGVGLFGVSIRHIKVPSDMRRQRRYQRVISTFTPYKAPTL